MEKDIAHAVLYECTTMIGLNIVSRMMLHFASFATCSKTQIASQKGIAAFTVEGWRNWNIGDKLFLKHMHSKLHMLAQDKYISFIIPNAAIDNQIEKE